MLARRPRRLLRRLPLFLAVMGPGIVTACAGNDAGGITTYSQLGAMYGTKLLWLLLVNTFVLAVVQEMCARMGAVTQKGFGELIREQFGVRWAFFALVIMFIANTLVTVAEFAGIAAAGQVFRASKYILVPASAYLMWALVTQGSFRRVERIFLALSATFSVSYVIAGILAVNAPDSRIQWGFVLRELVTPHVIADREFVMASIAAVGTTITPYMQLFLQSTVVDKGIKVSHYRYEQADVLFGSFITGFVAFFIMIASAAVIYQGDGVARIESARDAAHALRPLAGEFAQLLFGVGLFISSLLASAVLPLSTAYPFCEAFGWEMGIRRAWREAPTFYGIYTLMIIIGATAVLLPGLPLIRVIILSQFFNGILLPVVLVFLLRLINNPRIMGRYVNSRSYNLIAWFAVIVLVALTASLIVSAVW